MYLRNVVSHATAGARTSFRRECVACSCREKTAKKKKSFQDFFSWQGRRDSNTQPTVLETVALPLSHSPSQI